MEVRQHVRADRKGVDVRRIVRVQPEFPFWHPGWHPIYTQSPPLGLFGSMPSIPSDSGDPGRGQSCLFRYRKTRNCLIFKRFPRHLSVSSSLHPVSFPAAAPYPVGKGSAAIRRTMLPNSRRVR
jgi:hypothetical protein